MTEARVRSRLVVVGGGLVGLRCAEILARRTGDEVLVVAGRRPSRTGAQVRFVTDWSPDLVDETSTVVLATESERQLALTEQLLRRGVSVVATADHPEVVIQQRAMDALARTTGSIVVVGAAYSPGLSSLLAAWQVQSFDQVSSISIAQFGTGGPACARQHHRAASRSAPEVHRGVVRSARPGSGRELVWFPEPIGPADCYRAGLIEPLLLHQRYPEVPRIEARQAATRRDRLTSRWPMLRPPHVEGRLGAVWVEVRGLIEGRVEHRAMGATGSQATGAAATAAALATWVADARKSHAKGEHGGRNIEIGVLSAASFESPGSLLQVVANDVRLWTYDGSGAAVTSGGFDRSTVARKRKGLGEIVAIATKKDRAVER